MKKLEITPELIREVSRVTGREGGLKGGPARWSGVSARERTKLAKAAAKARWSKHRAKNATPP